MNSVLSGRIIEFLLEFFLCLLKRACQLKCHIFLVHTERLLCDIFLIDDIALISIAMQVETILIPTVFIFQKVRAELGRPIRSSDDSFIVHELVHVL